MTRTQSLGLMAKTLVLTSLLLVTGCKQPADPADNTLTSLQGSWKITSLTVDPGFVYMGVTVTNLSGALALLDGNCLNDAVVTFNANGSVSNNVATQASCANADNSKLLINQFFGPTTTYTETGNQITLRTGNQTDTGTAVYTTTSVTLTSRRPTDPAGNPIPTTYVVTLTKQ